MTPPKFRDGTWAEFLLSHWSTVCPPADRSGTDGPEAPGCTPPPLEARTFASRRRHLRPAEAAPSTRGGGTFDPRRRHLRPTEAAPSTHGGGTFLFVPWGGTLCSMGWNILFHGMEHFVTWLRMTLFHREE